MSVNTDVKWEIEEIVRFICALAFMSPVAEVQCSSCAVFPLCKPDKDVVTENNSELINP